MNDLLIKIAKVKLEDCIVIDKENVPYKGGRIIQFQKQSKSGKPLTFENGEICGIMHLNAFTTDSIDIIKQNVQERKMAEGELIQLIEENRLKHWIGISSPDYQNWKAGDVGTIRILWNEQRKFWKAIFVKQN